MPGKLRNISPRAALATALFSLFAAADGAAAAEYPWCAYYSMNGDVSNCGFVSYEQCRLTATPGAGAVCLRNPFYVTTDAKPRPATKRQPKS